MKLHPLAKYWLDECMTSCLRHLGIWQVSPSCIPTVIWFYNFSFLFSPLSAFWNKTEHGKTFWAFWWDWMWNPFILGFLRPLFCSPVPTFPRPTICPCPPPPPPPLGPQPWFCDGPNSFSQKKHPCLSQLSNSRNIASSRSTYRLNSQHLAAVPTSNIASLCLRVFAVHNHGFCGGFFGNYFKNE